jgi:hypothetical protein
VTEAEWTACNDPKLMLEFLKGKASDRKLRLFAVASCRHIWRQLRKKRSRRAVEVAEQYAEAFANAEELDAAHTPAYDAFRETPDKTIQEIIAGIAADVALLDASQAAESAIDAPGVAAHVAVYGFDPNDPPTTEERQAAYRDLEAAERAMQGCLLRCVFGNPFRPVAISPAILAWNDALVVRLAQAAYDERHLPEGTLNNGRLAVLADALEEAGCDNADILAHCRQPGDHVRGCWVVDAILGKT